MKIHPSPADFVIRISIYAYKTYILSRTSIENGFTSCLKGKELIVSRVTRYKLSNQTWSAYINHNRAMHKTLTNTKNGNYVIFLDKSRRTFVSRLVHSL